MTSTGGGFSVGGASGGGSRFMAGFEGTVGITVKVTPSPRPAAAPAAPTLQPAQVMDGGNTVELTTFAPTNVPPTTDTAATPATPETPDTTPAAAEEGRAGDVTAPVPLAMRLMVADDLLEERVSDGAWRDSVALRSELHPETGAPRRALGPVSKEPLYYVPEENERPPLHTLFMADTSQMHTAADELLTELRVTLEPAEQVGLHTALNAMGSRVEDFIGGSRTFWTRTIGRNGFGMQLRLELKLRAIVRGMRTRGVSQTSYQYDHTLTTASVSDSATRDLLQLSGSIGANASFTSDPRPQDYGGTADERNAATDHSHTPTGGYRYGVGAPRTLTVSAEGQSDRVDICLCLLYTSDADDRVGVDLGG
ncbi:hypothetical protein, partial [Streptomyces sp. NPDC058548]|uniref:hypothetical protein n=1 Tax=Streptomyces sp. NPDC058548 TaxID=3346545 RepID=UPI00365D8348